MTTVELIRALRAWAASFRNAGGYDCIAGDLIAAADRLEELDERVAIMNEKVNDAIEVDNMDMEKIIALLTETADYFKECRSNASLGSKAENHFWELQSAAQEAVVLLKEYQRYKMFEDDRVC